MADCVCVCVFLCAYVYMYICATLSLSPFVCPYAIAKGRRGQGEGHKKRKWAEAEEESERAGARRALSSAASNIWAACLHLSLFVCSISHLPSLSPSLAPLDYLCPLALSCGGDGAQLGPRPLNRCPSRGRAPVPESLVFFLVPSLTSYSLDT